MKCALVIGDGYIPTDVVITPDGTRAIVRSTQPPSVPTSSADKSRITVVELVGGSLDFQTTAADGALGCAAGVDHLECTNDWVVSAGERVYVPQNQSSVQFMRLD